MDLARLRFRYLAVMGLGSMAGVAACKAPATDGTTPVTTPSDSFPHPPSCPSHTFCVAQPAAAPLPDASAPDPFAMCPTKPDAIEARDSSQSVWFDPTGTASARGRTPATCCYISSTMCPGGRALRSESGEPLVAAAAARSDWRLDLSIDVSVYSDPERAALADRWAREAAFEHASIASFARVTLDLMALAAPPALIEAAQRASLDEIAHARIAYALASAFAGASIGPSQNSLFSRSKGAPTLADVAVEAFVEGAIGEARAALSLRAEARDAQDSTIAALLESIADDEERHVDLAWATIAWAVRTGGPTVVAALRAASEQAAQSADLLVYREIADPCLRALLDSRAAVGAATTAVDA